MDTPDTPGYNDESQRERNLMAHYYCIVIYFKPSKMSYAQGNSPNLISGQNSNPALELF